MAVFEDAHRQRDVGDEEFWRVGAVPARKYAPPAGSDVETVPVEQGAEETQDALRRAPSGVIRRPDGFTRQSYRGKGRPPAAVTARRQELLLTYEPEDSLIRRVSVYSWPSAYSFYEKFIANAHRSHAARGRECPRVPFFSYIPQYSQLNAAQQQYYFWFRDNARNGTFLPADISYILLYIYEIINLPDLIPPAEGCRILAGLWLAYRKTYRELDRDLSEWMCDYCLIHRLPPPEELRPILAVISARTTLREFYFSAGMKEPSLDGLAAAVIEAGTDYAYGNSRWYGENRELYDRMIPGAVAAMLRSMRDKGTGFFDPGAMRPVRLSRDAFSGSLCEHNIKRRIDLEVCSFTRGAGFRRQVTAAVKYAENKIRAHLRIRSRLTPGELTDEMRAPMDAYFAAVLPAREPAGEIPDYERYYDAPEQPFTPETAHAIEEGSWAVTRLLLEEDPAGAAAAAEDLMAPDPEEEPPEGAVVYEPEAAEETVSFEPSERIPAGYGNGGIRAALAALLAGGTLEDLCGGQGPLADDTASRINEEAYDRIGDVLLEKTDRWRLVEDYREEAEEWIRT